MTAEGCAYRARDWMPRRRGGRQIYQVWAIRGGSGWAGTPKRCLSSTRYGAVISDDGSRAINCQPESGGNRVAVDLQVLLLLSFDDNVKTVLSCVSVAVTLKEGCDAKVLMVEVSMVDWLTIGAVCRGRHV